jgi:hypothetical protein
MELCHVDNKLYLSVFNILTTYMKTLLICSQFLFVDIALKFNFSIKIIRDCSKNTEISACGQKLLTAGLGSQELFTDSWTHYN